MPTGAMPITGIPTQIISDNNVDDNNPDFYIDSNNIEK